MTQTPSLSSGVLCNVLTEVSRMGPQHVPWVRCTLLSMLRRSMIDMDAANAIADATVAILRRPGQCSLVAHPARHPDEFVGWIVTADASIVAGFVKPRFRRRGIFRRLMAEAIEAPEERTGVAVWTHDAHAMARAGFPIEFDLGRLEALARNRRS